LLVTLLPSECERIAVTGIPSAVLGAAVAQETGIPLLLAQDHSGEIHFGGELFPRVPTVLLEDVVETGGRALWGAQGLKALKADVTAVICLLDRQTGAVGRLADSGFTLRALFTEAELVGGDVLRLPDN
jgi:orotate phosphoribosyltransferase